MLGLIVFLLLAPGEDLVAAARAGDSATVASLLASGTDVNARDREGSTALMFAAMRGDAKMVQALLDAGADPNLKDANGETALLLGAARGVEIVRALLSEGADPNLADGEGQTPLLVAAENQPESVRLLIESGADVNHLDDFGVGALTVAEASGSAEIAALLRGAGAKSNPSDRLHDAIAKGDMEAVRRLIAEGADVNGFDTEFYETPLMAAIRHRRLEILELLVRSGANPAVEATGFDNAGETAIVMAARAESPWSVRVLLGAATRPRDRDEALLAGCAYPAVVRVALEMKANPNARGERGLTPLSCAAASGALESVTILLAAGADPALKADDGTTALGKAIQSGHTDVVEAIKRSLPK